MSANNIPYRTEIDGLRAIAVLLTVLFHLDVSIFKGGFLGVDVFFVISGYLITKILVEEIDRKGNISLQQFFTRRIVRIFPALIFTLCLVLCLAFIFFSPQRLIDSSAEALYASLSLSNFYFWWTSDYFAVNSSFSPLLHTWSLAVEEQFYLFWPLLLIFLCKLKKFKPLILLFVLIMLSIVTGLNFDNQGVSLITYFKPLSDTLDISKDTFYLLPFRAYQLLAGASAVWLLRSGSIPHFVRQGDLVGPGLLLILIPAMMVNGHSVAISMLTVIGTIFIILSNGECWICRTFLKNRVVVKVGLISYSLYLIHWPLIVFYKYAANTFLHQINFDTEWPVYDSILRFSDQLILFILSMLLALLMYKFIEVPPREYYKAGTRKKASLLSLLLISGMSLVAIASYSGSISNGFINRVPKLSPTLIQFIDSGGGEGNFHRQNYGGKGAKTTILDKNKPTIVLVGDSHARMYFTGVYDLWNKTHNIVLVDRLFGYKNHPAEDWLTDIEVLNSLPMKKHFIIASRWTFFKYSEEYFGTSPAPTDKLVELFATKIANFINHLNLTQDDEVVVFGNVPQIVGHGGLIDCLMRPKWLNSNKCEQTPIRNAFSLQYKENFNKSLEKYLLVETYRHPIKFFDPFTALCIDRVCKQIINGELLYSDEDHLSKQGSMHVIRYFKNAVDLN